MLASDTTALAPGRRAAHGIGTGTYPGYTVVVSTGWFDYLGGEFIVRYPDTGKPDVNGQRLVVDATYSPDTSTADRAALAQVVGSLRFGVH